MGARPDQAPLDLAPDASFEDYLALTPEEDEVTEHYLDPLSMKGAPKAVPSNGHEVCSSTMATHSCQAPAYNLLVAIVKNTFVF